MITVLKYFSQRGEFLIQNEKHFENSILLLIQRTAQCCGWKLMEQVCDMTHEIIDDFLFLVY